jgi:hypothetical protein
MFRSFLLMSSISLYHHTIVNATLSCGIFLVFKAVMNILVQVILWTYVFISRSLDRCIFHFLRIYQTVFQSEYIFLHPANRVKVLII